MDDEGPLEHSKRLLHKRGVCWCPKCPRRGRRAQKKAGVRSRRQWEKQVVRSLVQD